MQANDVRMSDKSANHREIDRLIAPEIKNDAFSVLITRLAATENIKTVLEIGSSAGDGSTRAFVKGLAVNPNHPQLFCVEVSPARCAALRDAYHRYDFVHCYNMSTVRLDELPSEQDVIDFYQNETSKLTRFPLAEVLGWLRQGKDDLEVSGVECGAIEKIKQDHAITDFDMVLIDGSEFTGNVEYEKIDGAKIILLDDTCTYKTFRVRQRILADPRYELVTEDPELRHGFAVFCRRDFAMQYRPPALPIHFFTIVLNGEPFIRYHEKILAQLPISWHWHIIEGVASLSHDTAWSTVSGGHVAADAHHQGRSNDGTSDYLDDLVRRMPGRVTLYRKPPDVFWDGKCEMCNAPLATIDEPSLLWQIDADELWTVPQILAVRRLFLQNPEKTAAFFWCHYFVGPRKIISTRNNYGQNPSFEWLRVWRFNPGDRWLAHEPPTLGRRINWFAAQVHNITAYLPFRRNKRRAIRSQCIDVARLNSLMHVETEAVGAVFQHLAYVTDAQLRFKETYYGYSGALEKWRALQNHRGSGLLRDYFPWVHDNCKFDDISTIDIEPIAQVNCGRWEFSTSNSSLLQAVQAHEASAP